MSDITIQDIVKSLESFKRHLGRQYDVNKIKQPRFAHAFAKQYNTVERQIQWLCNNFNAERTTKEYFLEEK